MSPQEHSLIIPSDTPPSHPASAPTPTPPTPAPPEPQHHITHNMEMQQPPSLTNVKHSTTTVPYHRDNEAYQKHDTDKLGVTKQPSTLSMTITPASNTTTDKEIGDGGFDFDDLLPHIGEFGIYQRMLFLCMIPFACYVAWVYFTQIFITLTPEQHWCWVPELANLTKEQRVALAIPQTQDGLEKCRMYAVDYEQVIAEGATVGDPAWPTVACLHGWEYNYTDVPYVTIASELDWVCEQAALPSIAQAIFFCGAILGGLVFGWLADRRGRIPALMGSNIVGCIGGIATAFCTSFWGFCMCRFLVGMAFDNCFTMMYILVLEYVGPRWRTFVANMSIAIFFTIAATCLPYIALYVADWRTLSIVTSAPLILAIFTPWVVPESARWLASQGKIEKAVCILRKFERINKTKVDDELYKEFATSVAKIQKEELDGKSYSVMDLFRTPRLRNITILLILIWMAISLVFDGHVRNVGSLGLDIFLTFAIASATEFPADTFLTLVLDRWGRRWLACGTMVASGVFSLLATTVPVGIPSASLAIVGRFAVNISYNIGLQYAAELLPTVVRAQGVALIHIMGYVASIVAPFVVYLGNVSTTLPLLILGGLGIVGGVLALFLPETMDQELPQTLQDGEQFGINQKFFEFPCCGKKQSGSDDDSTTAISCPAQQQQKQQEQPPVERFRRTTTSAGSSFRGSFRGEVRSTLIHRTSTRRSTRSSATSAGAGGGKEAV